jgi:hypothetical protein
MDKTSSQSKEFLHYRLEADTLCLGERIRGSLFRPCINVFTYTALVGSLKARFPYPYRSIHAVGRFLNHDPSVNLREIMTFSPRDRGREVSVVPLEIEYLANVCAEVFVFKNDFTVKWPDEFTIHLGAMKSKGFGCCHLKLIDAVPCTSAPRPGILDVRLPEDDDAIKEVYSIRKVASPVYGYLFRPDTGGTGHYVRSLFEGTKLVADPVLFQH